jgi:hypothetical protein
VPNIGVQVINVTFRNVVGTVVPSPTSTMATATRAMQITSTAKIQPSSREDDFIVEPHSAMTTHLKKSRGDPTFLTDAAGTFVCFRNRPCSVVLDGVRVAHANAATRSPPAWLCGNTTVAVGAGGVAPPLSGGC